MLCMRAWSDWVVYPPEFLLSLQNTFLGINERVFTCCILLIYWINLEKMLYYALQYVYRHSKHMPTDADA